RLLRLAHGVLSSEGLGDEESAFRWTGTYDPCFSMSTAPLCTTSLTLRVPANEWNICPESAACPHRRAHSCFRRKSTGTHLVRSTRRALRSALAGRGGPNTRWPTANTRSPRNGAPHGLYRPTEGRRSTRRRSWALSATMIVDRLINTAPTAGASTNPTGART